MFDFSKKYKCPECHEVFNGDDIGWDEEVEEYYCPHCGEWFGIGEEDNEASNYCRNCDDWFTLKESHSEFDGLCLECIKDNLRAISKMIEAHGDSDMMEVFDACKEVFLWRQGE